MPKRIGIVLATVALALAMFRNISPAARGSTHPDVEASPLVGQPFAESLGLKPVTDFPVTGCQYFAEAADGLGYCLDSVARSALDARILSIQVTGRVPTDIDAEIFNLTQQLEAIPDTPENQLEIGTLETRITQLRQQQLGG